MAGVLICIPADLFASGVRTFLSWGAASGSPFIKKSFWRPISLRRWEERKLPIGRNPLRGAVFEWERLTPNAFAGNGGLDKVRKRFNVASTGLTLVHRSEEHTSELQSHLNLVCRLLLEKKKK